MLPLGHVAYTWAAVRWLQAQGRAVDLDYRLVAAASLLPDLVDKPLSLTLLSNSGTSQGLAHTLLGQALLSLAVARFRPDWLPYALVANSHLAADQMWKYPQTLFFPFSGHLDSWKYMGSPGAMLQAYAEIARRPSIVAVELLGLALLAWFLRRERLWQKDRLGPFLRTGRPPATEAEGVAPCAS